MIRKAPLKPGSPPRRKTRPRRQRVSPTEWARQYGSTERVVFVGSLRCVVDGCHHDGPRENHHIHTRRTAGFTSIVPVCAPHHIELHQHGKQTFAMARKPTVREANRMDPRSLMRLAGIDGTPVHRDGIVYHRAHSDSDNGGNIVVQEGDLADLIRDWWRLRVRAARTGEASDER